MSRLNPRHSKRDLADWDTTLHALTESTWSCTCPVWWHCPCTACVARLLADATLKDAAEAGAFPDDDQDGAQ